MNIAINTDYMGDDINPEICLRHASEAGFSYVQWCHEWCTDYLYSDSEIEQIGEWLKKYNLKLDGIHATHGRRKDYRSSNESVRTAGVELVKNRIDMAYRLGTYVIVLHMYMPGEPISASDLENFYSHVFKSLDELEPFCRERGVKIAFENLMESSYEVQVAQFKTLFKRYGSDFLGLCIDTGHANKTFKKENQSLEFLDTFKERLISVHIHDNDGLSDLHRLPFTDTIDWDKVLKLIAKSPYNKCFMMEVTMGNCGIKDEMEFLKEAYRIGEKGAAVIERFRNS